MKKLFVLFLFITIIAQVSLAKTIRYVKADGSGDGSSWANASSSIQTMIDNSAAGDEVWVAKGTYYPTTETIARNARSRTFLLKDSVNIRGGFVGTETAISQRAITDLDSNGKIDSCELVNKTILNGDIDGIIDVWTKTINTDGKWSWSITGNEGNCYHVITCSGTNTLDGLSITGGFSNITNKSNGGGIYSLSTSNITNCTISNCTASNDGGGIYTAASAKISNCSLSNCSASNSGGGIISFSSSYSSSYSSSITNCTVNNCSAFSGGGISVYASFSSSTSVDNCSVSNCSAGIGGGINTNASYSSTISVNNCSSSNCSGSNGGGIYTSSGSNSSSYVTNCTISNCTASNDGGGIYTAATTFDFYYSDISFTSNCLIINCLANNFGGGIYASFNSENHFEANNKYSISNCSVSNCSAGSGGGIYSYNSSSFSLSPTYITNCMTSNCSASSYGGIYALTTSISPTYLTNCAVSNNMTGTIASNISGGTQTNNINPNIALAYVKPSNFVGTATTDAQRSELLTVDWHLKEGSTCINAGTSSNISSEIILGKDCDQNPRVLYGTIDIGAYEYFVPIIAIPTIENFNSLSSFSNSQVFYHSTNVKKLNDIRWTIVNQKADFTWQTNLTSTYSQPIFTYQIDATKASKVFLRYDMYFQAYAGTISPLGTEKLNVEYSTDLVTWSTIATYSNANGTIANQTYKHDLSSILAGKHFFIRFNANGANSNRIEKWEIDNVIIDADGLSAVNTTQQDKYKYSVVNGILHLTDLEYNVTIQIYDSNGKLLVNNIESQSANYKLPAQGVYIIKIASNNSIELKKIIW